jgi:ketosteroid isomerase-like protein
MSHSDDEVADLIALETERCRAISELDLPALEKILADDLTHTHITGHTEDKATYLAGLSGRPRKTTRGDLSVRIYGDTAVMTGALINEFPAAAGNAPARLEIQALQVWVRSGGTWQMVAFGSSGQANR